MAYGDVGRSARSGDSSNSHRGPLHRVSTKRQGDIRLQIDRYDRRYAIFSGARELLSDIMTEGKFETRMLLKYMRETGDAVFLTNDDVVKYLEELRLKAIHLQFVNSMANKRDANLEKYTTEEAEILTWFSKQYEVLIKKFRPLLSYEKT